VRLTDVYEGNNDAHVESRLPSGWLTYTSAIMMQKGSKRLARSVRAKGAWFRVSYKQYDAMCIADTAV
jgi:hypothetical protein